MATKKQTEANEAPATPAAKPKKTKKPVKNAAPASAKPAKVPREKKPKEDLVVFAFRLTEAERDLIHETAGPRNATGFVRRVAVAFAGGDEPAFRAVLKEARELRG